MSQSDQLNNHFAQDYSPGWETRIDSDTLAEGLTEETIRFISAKKKEPQFLLDFRLRAFEAWKKSKEPHWLSGTYSPIDYQKMSYFSAPKSLADRPKSLEDVDPVLLETYEKLGIPLHERAALAGVAVDAVFDSVSIGTTFRETLRKAGVIFCSFSEAVQEVPELIEKYLGSVVPIGDNFFATLNAAVFSDGSFCYIPKGVRCPMELSTYFRINALNTGQFERTLIIADEGSHVSYLEGCSAPRRDEHQLHAAVVELVALDDAQIKYSTVQNWYPGDNEGKGGVLNFVTKRGLCSGKRSKISWTQLETGSAITWKYPSVILMGDDSVGEFYSVAVTKAYQQADTGTKMIHLGKRTKSTIISKGICAGLSSNTYRGLVRVGSKGADARNFTQCDSLIIGPHAKAYTYPTIKNAHNTAHIEHEASTSRISVEQMAYLAQRGVDPESALSLIVTGFCKDVVKELPLEFAVEAQKLLQVSLEGSVG